MSRLTQKENDGRWCMRGLPWEDVREGAVITKKAAEMIYACFYKLKDYEDTGLDPGQVGQIRQDLEELDNLMKNIGEYL